MTDVTIGWFVVPGALAAVLGSAVTLAWQHFAGKDLRALESRLRRQEETFRLSQSPRISAASELWIALRSYERAFSALVSGVQRIHTPEGATHEDWPRLSEEHGRSQRREWRSAWKALGAARDKAEVLLDPEVFRLFDLVVSEYAKANEEQEWLLFPSLTNGEEVRHRRDEHLARAAEQRSGALDALHVMMSPEKP